MKRQGYALPNGWRQPSQHLGYVEVSLSFSSPIRVYVDDAEDGEPIEWAGDDYCIREAEELIQRLTEAVAIRKEAQP